MRHSSAYRAINRSLGKAQHRYDMISDQDRVLVGLSGGKDSLTLMWALSERLKRVPINYELLAVFVDPGFSDGFADSLDAYCQEQGYSLRIEYTDFGLRGHSPENRENPCFLCARLRRQRLFEVADQLRCTKIALGHHKDDLIETLFLNMCYAGEISTMMPRQSFFQGRFEIIRPLAFVDEKAIVRFAKEQRFPKFINPCPSDGASKRKEMGEMLSRLYKSNPKIKGNIFRSMSHVRMDYLLG